MKSKKTLVQEDNMVKKLSQETMLFRNYHIQMTSLNEELLNRGKLILKKYSFFFKQPMNKIVSAVLENEVVLNDLKQMKEEFPFDINIDCYHQISNLADIVSTLLINGVSLLTINQKLHLSDQLVKVLLFYLFEQALEDDLIEDSEKGKEEIITLISNQKIIHEQQLAILQDYFLSSMTPMKILEKYQLSNSMIYQILEIFIKNLSMEKNKKIFNMKKSNI